MSPYMKTGRISVKEIRVQKFSLCDNKRDVMCIRMSIMNRTVSLCSEKESAGIPEEILKANPDTCVRIPMIGETRSLNLSNSVAIVLYEALRQNDFDHMKLEGQLHRLSWDD